MTFKAIALDAMGVIYPVADDLRKLLIPYLRARGCELPDDALVDLFRACYRDGMPARDLWRQTGCDWADGALETDFLALYELRPGVTPFLEAMRTAGIPLYGLSNDVAEWALTRRQAFGIAGYFQGGSSAARHACSSPTRRSTTCCWTCCRVWPASACSSTTPRPTSKLRSRPVCRRSDSTQPKRHPRGRCPTSMPYSVLCSA